MSARVDRATVLFVGSALLVVVAVLASMAVDSATTRGLLIGASLGLVNMILGSYFTSRSLAGEPGAVLINIAAGFGARFMVLIGLLAVFTFVTSLGVSPAAFGFTFLALMFVYFGIEAALALRFQRREAA
ncbi:MAG TPA: hypothetical protein VFN21_00640 [Acidimicrobiales bacterium]|nr:hypothetical protein [Acidimicrobiales bacterium]